ncbi:MAG: CDP-alcohol phosphatidyltransferase family protein [Gammaproteobacteria bacterium]|nr:CDP-alcohol phosphatidyltransferase family protein [Gammaproteobacteria bacterium]
MTICAFVFETSPVRLWGLSSDQRLQRLLKAVGKESSGDKRNIHWLESCGELPSDGHVLLLNGTYLFENRTLTSVLQQPDSILQSEDHTPVAAFISARRIGDVLPYMEDPGLPVPQSLHVTQPGDMEAFDENLKRSTRPLLEKLNAERRTELENRLYGNAYKGITDLVTKFVWPKPAKRFVHLCASMHVSPNMVTSFGLLLVVATCYLFLKGYYGWGLLAGWLMTFLDTVDGKLARVTIQSSKFGHLYDHLIDLFHPPFWYIYWGMSLTHFQPVMGQGQEQMYWTIIISYIVGRVVEGLFPLLGTCGIFTWRPYDAWFRLVTARRNPCLILLTLSFLVGKPEWGFIAVTFWSALTSLALVLRLLQATVVRLNQGPLISWLSETDVATGSNAYSFSVFGATRGAYAKQ